MRAHPREQPINTAISHLEMKILAFLSDLEEELSFELTEWEALKIVHHAYFQVVASTIKHRIRVERHPDDPDYPGGLE